MVEAEVVASMLLRLESTTPDVVCEVVGWKGEFMPRAAAAAEMVAAIGGTAC